MHGPQGEDRGKPARPTELLRSLCEVGTAPPPGQERARMRVAPPGEGTSGWLRFHCPFPLFSEPQRHRAGLCVRCRRLARPGRLSGSQPGCRGDRGRGSPSSLASTIPCATPWLASPKQHRLSSGASDAKGREEREKADGDGVRVLWRQQPGLVWMSKAIAQQPTLWRRPKKQRAGGCRPVTHTVGALCARIG